ncbi:MAG: hypothetical protein GXP25_00460 [Planctomycetes bacterium]|nr:hypothetical protein [Planctomycetota bacterium]
MMKRFVGVLVLLLALGCEDQPKTFHWRNVGPGGGGWIQSLAMDPVDFDTIHVGCDVGGYYQSTDGGKTFTILNKGLRDYFIEDILVDASDNRIIYLATPSGVHKSTDGGQSWTLKRNGFPEPNKYKYSAPIGRIVMDPKDHRVLYAGVGRPRMRSYGKGQIYKTTDGAESWTLLSGIAKHAKDAVIHGLAIHPEKTNILFAATNEGLFKSADGGLTWTRKEKGLPHRYCRNVVIHPTQPNVMYVVMWSTPGKTPWQGGVYRSDDGGDTWTARNDGLPQKVAKPGDAWQKTCNYIRFMVDPRDPDRIFVGANSWWGAGLYRSTDGGKHWELNTRRGEKENTDRGWITFWGLTVKCIAYSPIHPDHIILGTSGIVMRTTNSGDTWKQFYTREVSPGRWQGNGIEVTCLSEITIDPHNRNRIYCGYADIGILLSEDAGRSWRRVASKSPAHGDMGRVVCDPDRPGVAWYCEGKSKLGKGTVGMTTDGGNTWTIVGCEKTGLPMAATRFLTLDPKSPVDARTLYVVSHGNGVYKSVDGGASWRAINNGLGQGKLIISALAMDPMNPKRLFAAISRPDGGLFCTEDGGASWQRVYQPKEFFDVFDIAIDPNNPQTIFVACRDNYDHKAKKMYQGGLFKSIDGGRTWRRVFEDRFASRVRVSPFDSNVIYIGTNDHPYHDFATGRGVFVSRDGGETWTEINDGLTVKQIGVITLDPKDPKRIYAGTGGNGLFIGTWE